MNQIIKQILTPLCLLCLTYFSSSSSANSSVSSYADQSEYVFVKMNSGQEVKVLVSAKLIYVVVGRDDRPTLLCKQTSEGCVALDDVIFTDLEKGGWRASFPYSNVLNSARRQYGLEIDEALANMSQLNYRCTISYAGERSETMTANLVCLSQS